MPLRRGKETPPEEGMLRYRIAVGHEHHVKPANIVGAIANEAGLDSQYIGRIDIFDDYSLVDLPEGMPRAVFNDLKDVWVSGQKMKLTLHGKHDKPGKAGKAGKADKPAAAGSPGKTTTTRRKKPAGKPGGAASRRKNPDGSKPPVRKKKATARAKPGKRPAKAEKKKPGKTKSR